MKYNNASNITNYMNALHSVGCSIFTDKPTRVTSHSATCIDHIYSNLRSDMLNNHIIESEVSDHYGTLTKISSLFRNSLKKEIFVRKSNLSENEWQQFNVELQNTFNDNSLMVSIDTI